MKKVTIVLYVSAELSDDTTGDGATEDVLLKVKEMQFPSGVSVEHVGAEWEEREE